MQPEILVPRMKTFVEAARKNYQKPFQILEVCIEFEAEKPTRARLRLPNNANVWADIQNLFVKLRGDHENDVDPYIDPLTIMAQTLGGKRHAENWVRTSITKPYEVAGAFFWVVKLISTSTESLEIN